MNKELEKKKKNAKITLSTLDDVAPNSPTIDAEVDGANHENAAWLAGWSFLL